MSYKSQRRTLITDSIIEKYNLFEKVENMKIEQSCFGNNFDQIIL